MKYLKLSYVEKTPPSIFLEDILSVQTIQKHLKH